MSDIKISDEAREKFLRCVDTGGPIPKHRPELGKCWVWTAGKLSKEKQYGCSGDGLAHRTSYKMFVGPIPNGHLVCHHCDNPPCVRPSHLFTGHYKENNADMWNKGRAVKPPTHRGEEQQKSILTEHAVLEIVRLFKAGATRKNIASNLGVSYSAVREILIGRNWKHVTGIKK